ncbi:MAG: hypothetical protein CML16_03230 [Pusillimonas sp.]|nr:hypothetical protein [Pusillimonas sp.]MBC43600.1 hypothetical protein [Pusillimonas sp.]|tara:strand:- start:4033 stop:4512 length:480 start_codon:yes stop_codon:yes gene_type:complete
MKSEKTLECVELVLRQAKEPLSISAIGFNAKTTEDETREALRHLAQSGQIELIAGGRNGNRYTWLNTEKPVVSKDNEEPQEHAQKPVDAEFRADPNKEDQILLLLRVPKRKPRVIKGLNRAAKAAIGAVKNGAPSADVYVLQPVGSAVRGAIWKGANKS